MIIGILTVELDIPEAFSLKDKRAVLNRARERVRKKFNVAIAEVADNDVWNHACLGIVTISNQQRYANQVLSKVLELVESLPNCSVEDVSMEFL